MSRADAPPFYSPLFTGFWSLRVSVILKTRLVHQQVRVQTGQVFPVLMGHCVTLHDYSHKIFLHLRRWWHWEGGACNFQGRKKSKHVESTEVVCMTHYDSLLQIKFVTSVHREQLVQRFWTNFILFLNSHLNEERTPAFSDHWNIKKNVICRIKAQILQNVKLQAAQSW